MISIWRDLRYGWRLIQRAPGFAGVIVATLALGIGANTAIFSVINGVLLKPLPFPESHRLVSICETNPEVAGYCVASPTNVEDWAAQASTLETIGIARSWPFILKTTEGATGVNGGLATPSAFRALGVRAHRGRLFLPDDLPPGDQRVVVLSHELWSQRFGADPGIIGGAITLSEEPYDVIGVLPPGLEVPEFEWVELWTPPHFNPRDEEVRDWRGFVAYARLAAGVDIETAREEMSLIAGRLAERYPVANQGWGVKVVSLQERVVGSVRPKLLIFLAAVGIVLLIGCANVANLLLARATGRRREFAVRSSLGAGRWRLVRLLLTESLVLAVIGGAAGLLLSIWATEAFTSLAPPGIPRIDEIGLDGRVLAFVAGLSVLTTLLFGITPAFLASSVDLQTSMKKGEQFAGGRQRLGVRAALVVSEVALALVLLIGAGLLVQSFAGLLRWEPGFETDNLVTVWLLASQGKYTQGDQVNAMFERAVGEVDAIPGVEAAGATSAGPLFGGREQERFTLLDRIGSGQGEGGVARWYDVDPGYFRALGLPMMKGRNFTTADRRDAPAVVIVNESMAARYWPDGDPIGQRISMYDRTMTVIGVVSDARPLRAGTPVPSEVYWPKAQAPRWGTYLVVRTGVDASQLIPSIRNRLEQVDPDMSIGSFQTMDNLVDRQLVEPRFNMALLGIFSLVALALAAVGIYGVIAYAVAQRTREIGIRVALGAERADIAKTVLQQGMGPALFGVGLGLIGAFGFTRGLRDMLFGVDPTDPATFAAVAVGLIIVAAVACYTPARRATRVDPMEALRHE